MSEASPTETGDHVIEVARAIRSFLPGLVGAAADGCDAALRGLLERGRAGDDVRGDILAVLSRWSATQDWAVSMLTDPLRRPPGLQNPSERSFSRLPGLGDPVDVQRYACPRDGDYVWYRTSVGMKIPECPDHGEILVVSHRQVE